MGKKPSSQPKKAFKTFRTYKIPKNCTRCRRTGHLVKDCTWMYDVKDRIIKSTEKERKSVSDKLPREDETNEIEPFISRGANFIPFNDGVDNVSTGPGLYELGVLTSKNAKQISVLYVGMSGNVKERLTDHITGEIRIVNGRERSSHLTRWIDDYKRQKKPLFYRYVPLDTWDIAKQEESALLRRFFYAWNIDENDKISHHQL